jgi:hypothetical protein
MTVEYENERDYPLIISNSMAANNYFDRNTNFCYDRRVNLIRRDIDIYPK